MITVKPDRTHALEAGYKAMQGRLDIDFEAFSIALENWRVDAFHDGEKAVGMLMTKGPELHVAVLPEVRGKWLSRRLIREVIGPLIERHGEARTDVADGNEIGREFVARLGFEKGRIKALRDGFAKGTFDPATVLGGAALGSAIIGSDAAQSAASTQAGAAGRAADTQMAMFNTINNQNAPYRQAGQNALSLLLGGIGKGSPVVKGYENMPALGAGITTGDPQRDRALMLYNRDLINSRGYGLQSQEVGQDATSNALNNILGSDNSDAKAFLSAPATQSGSNGLDFLHQFNAGDLNANLAPNWAFSLEQGQGAAKNALNLTGGIGGNFGKGLIDYTLNKSGDLYQQAFGNYTANQTNIFNRLASIAGLGQTANQASGQAGTTLAGNAGNATIAGGAAQAAGTVGSANAISGGLTNAASWYSLPSFLNAGSNNVPLVSEMTPGQFSLGNAAYG